MAIRNRKMMKVDLNFQKMLENMQRELSKRRGYAVPLTQLTAELATKNFDKFMLKVLQG